MEVDNSFDGNEPLDLNCIVPEFQEDELTGNKVPVKKLSQMFDSCASKDTSGLKVYLRVRAIPSKLDSTITVESSNSIATNAPESSKRAQYSKREERHYTFSHVFAPQSQQTEVFDIAVAPLAEKFVQGESAVLFAYGMTNAGKTYTIQGNSQNPGILPRLVNSILDQSKEFADCKLQMSMLEIYQEKIYDLLSTKREKLTIRDGSGKVEVGKLSSHSIASDDEALKLLGTAAANRSRATTLLNSGSSRSHAVYSISLYRTVNGKEVSSVFQLVDLAGAERGNRTKAGLAQQREANNINMSLMNLWRCLQSMKKNTTTGTGSNSSSNEIIPFRESKLTHLLMPQLCRAGASCIAMITCINPQVDDYDETLSILNNASIACKIKEIADLGRVAAIPTMIASRSSDSADALIAPSASSDASEVPIGTVSNLVAAIQKSNSFKQTDARKRKHDSMLSASATGSRKASTASASQHAQLAAIAAAAVAAVEDEKKLSLNSSESNSEIMRLKRTIQSLEEENESLQYNQLQREAEIRVEVSNEMEERSKFLFEQIQTLQQQLLDLHDSKFNNNSNSSSSTFDVTRSVKKLKKDHMQQQHQEDLSRHILEAEEEMERIKSSHLKEIEQLKAANEHLNTQVNMWKAKAEEAIKNLSEQQQVHKIQLQQAQLLAMSSNSNSNSTSNVATPGTAAEFSQRMLRDNRFKRSNDSENAENAAPIINLKAQVQAQQLRAASPVRSPLGPLRNDPNSPIRLDALNMKPSQQQAATATASTTTSGNNTLSLRQRAKANMTLNIAGEQDENMPVQQTYSTRSRALRA